MVKRSGYCPWLAGKLSDVAIMVFLPALLCAWWLLFQLGIQRVFKRREHIPFPTQSVMMTAILIAGLAMISLQLSENVSEFYYEVMNKINQTLWNRNICYPTQDPTDIITCLFLIVPYVLFKKTRERIEGDKS